MRPFPTTGSVASDRLSIISERGIEEAPTLVQDGHLGLIAMRERVDQRGRARERDVAEAHT